MSRLFSTHTFRPLVLCAALAGFCGASVMAQVQAPPQENPAPPAAQGQRTDGQIEMDVVKALDASSALTNDLITAATIQSEVTLSGTVATDADKDLAGSVASRVDGVTKVHNNLQVGNPQQAAQDQGYSIGDTSDGPPPEPSGQAGQQSQPQEQPEPPDQAQQQGEDQQPPPYPNSSVPYPGQDQAGQPQGPDQGAYPPPPPPGSAPYPPQYGSQNPQPYPGQPQDQGQYPPPPGPNQPPYGQQPQPYPGPDQAPYGQQPPPYPGPNQGSYGQQRPEQQPAYSFPRGPVTVPAGMLIQVRTAEAVSSKKAVAGTPVQFTVVRDVTYGGVLAIPRGATLHGVVTESQPAQTGKLAGRPELGLSLTSLDLDGKSYPVQSDLFKVKGPNKAGYTAGNAVGGALLGAIIGGIAGGGSGAAIGAGVGAGAGTAASAATRGPNAWIPPEAQVSFHLGAPLTVDPVTEQEAERLAEGLNPGGPNLHRRGGPYGPGPYRYGPYYGPRPYPYYPYPPAYYRPYYRIGGVYYWR
jgi:hypothetical protein